MRKDMRRLLQIVVEASRKREIDVRVWVDVKHSIQIFLNAIYGGEFSSFI